MRLLPAILATLLLTSCATFLEPNFYRMSETELASYNSSVAAPDQVRCMQVNFDPNQQSRRICGTLEEIEQGIVPTAPGSQLNSVSAFPALRKSRSSNPPLTPTAVSAAPNQ